LHFGKYLIGDGKGGLVLALLQQRLAMANTRFRAKRIQLDIFC